MVLLRGIKFGTALAALALFFLPWLDIQCSGKSLATQSGIQTITGQATPSRGMPVGRGSLEQEQPESLGSAGWVAAALVALCLAVLLLLLALVGNHPLAEACGSVLCALCLVLLLGQAIQGFPVKDALVQSAAVDNASNDTNFGSTMAMAVMANFQIKLLPAFIISCVLSGIPGLLSLHLLLNRLAGQAPGRKLPGTDAD